MRYYFFNSQLTGTIEKEIGHGLVLEEILRRLLSRELLEVLDEVRLIVESRFINQVRPGIQSLLLQLEKSR